MPSLCWSSQIYGLPVPVQLIMFLTRGFTVSNVVLTNTTNGWQVMSKLWPLEKPTSCTNGPRFDLKRIEIGTSIHGSRCSTCKDICIISTLHFESMNPPRTGPLCKRSERLMLSTFPGVWHNYAHVIILLFAGDSTDQGLWGAVLLYPNSQLFYR